MPSEVETAPAERSALFTDVESSEDAVGRVFHPHSISVTSPSRGFRGLMTWAALGPLVMGDLDYNVGLFLDCPQIAGYHLNMPVRGALRSCAGGNDVYTTPGSAVIYRRDIAASVRTVSDSTFYMFALKIDGDALENALAAMLGRDPGDGVAFGPEVDLASGTGRQWWDMLAAVRRQHGQGDLLANPMVTAPLSQALLNGLLLAAPHQYSDLLREPARPAVPASARLAEDYILEHLHEPLTVAEVAASVGTSTRALQRGFLQHLGMTPTQYIRWRRLQRVHADLVAGDPARTHITDVAARWGFSHHGRFARDYRRAFGVTPTMTLNS
jgi:AraC-like DNA-binding protein